MPTDRAAAALVFISMAAGAAYLVSFSWWARRVRRARRSARVTQAGLSDLSHAAERLLALKARRAHSTRQRQVDQAAISCCGPCSIPHIPRSRRVRSQ